MPPFPYTLVPGEPDFEETMGQAGAMGAVAARWHAANDKRNRRLRVRKIEALTSIYGPLSRHQNMVLERLRWMLESEP